MPLRSAFALAVVMAAGLTIPCSAQSGCEDCAVFNLHSTFESGETIDGTLTLNTTTDLFSAADLIVSGFPSGDTTLIYPLLQETDPVSYNLVVFDASYASALNLEIPTTSLAAYDGSSICTASDDCGGIVTNYSGSGYFQVDATAGSLTSESVAPTPEPSSLILLGTGLLGVAGAMRRRFV